MAHLKNRNGISKCVVLLLMIFLFHPISAAADEMTASLPTAAQLLDKYAKVQDKLQSFIVNGRCITTTTCNEANDKSRSWKKHSLFELRRDVSQTNLRTWEWGQVGPAYAAEENPFYISKYWTGSRYIRYAFQDKRKIFPSGDVTVEDNPMMANFDQDWVEPSELRGYFYGIGERGERIDIFLKNTKGLSLESKPEKLGDVLCYRLKADTAGGEIVLWIDPMHDYNIAQASVRMKEGDLYEQKIQLKKGHSVTLSLRNVEFKKFSDIWIPVKAEAIYRIQNFQSEGVSSIDKKVYDIKDFRLNPDHKKLKSFVINDIHNGAVVLSYLGHTNAKGGLEQFTWNDNRIIDKNGETVATIEK